MNPRLRIPKSADYFDISASIAVMIERSSATPDQRHMGLIAEIFPDERPGQRWLIDHGFHRHTRANVCDWASETQCWLPVVIEEDVADGLLHLCDIVRSRYTGRGRGLPYSIRYAGGAIRREGSQLTFDEHGFTCASFVVALFRGVGLRVIDLASWSARTAQRQLEDTEWQRKMVADIRVYTQDNEHADREQGEIPCFRFRPEEIVAALAIGNGAAAVSFSEAEPLSRELLDQLP
ncbi:MAG: hypothetical protein JNK05_05725 [Myxococcales bacterium]|nr:hypothetical protein [Myxococcales bacterium]